MKLKEAIQSANLHNTTTHAKAKADAVEGKAAHTPGPFSSSGIVGDNHILAPWRGGKASVAIVVAHPHMKPGELEANKALLAAAPEMLEALEYCLAPLQDEYNRATHTGHATNASRAFLKAKQAIAKAKGSL